MQKTFHRLFKIIDFKKEYQQKSSGLNYTQLHVLEKIYKEKQLKTLEISKQMELSPSTLIGILDELEKQGLIVRTRQQADKRVVLVSTAPKGEKLVRRHLEEDELFLKNLLKNLNEDEQEQLKLLINRISEAVDKPEDLFR